jgi:hypothetical protein
VLTDAPVEVIDSLLAACFVGMMEAKGAEESLVRAEKQLARAEENVGPLIRVRNTGAQRKISAFPNSSAALPFVGW